MYAWHALSLILLWIEKKFAFALSSVEFSVKSGKVSDCGLSGQISEYNIIFWYFQDKYQNIILYSDIFFKDKYQNIILYSPRLGGKTKKKRCFFPTDTIGLLRSNFGIFLLRKFGVEGGLFWSARGCNLAAHSSIHASFILRIGLTRFQLPNGFLDMRIVECRNSSDILEWGPGAIQTGNIKLNAPENL